MDLWINTWVNVYIWYLRIEDLLSSENIWQKSHVLLFICKLIILSWTVFGKMFAKRLAKGFRKTSNECVFWEQIVNVLYHSRSQGRFVSSTSKSSSFLYSYSFELNPDWTESYSPQPEIHEYLERVANKYDIGKHVEFEKRVMKTTWNEKTNKWTIELDTGEVNPIPLLLYVFENSKGPKLCR